MATTHIKVEIRRVISHKKAIVTGKYDSKEDAENSPEKGEVHPVIAGYTLVKSINDKKVTSEN